MYVSGVFISQGSQKHCKLCKVKRATQIVMKACNCVLYMHMNLDLKHHTHFKWKLMDSILSVDMLVQKLSFHD